ncbi:hypothetical protein H4582DRAFT_5952 [Lactarius indigo]|nr:hypothetical protein H4582DRAFT_5952 [Lactarius indigo]
MVRTELVMKKMWCLDGSRIPTLCLVHPNGASFTISSPLIQTQHKMSQRFVEVIEPGNVPKEGTSTSPGRRLCPQFQMSEGESSFTDGSDPLFTMYNEMAGEEDERTAESWKADTDRILIFTGLFSAAVATLVAVSIQDLRPNPQDRSTFYLQNIYQLQLLADPNTPNVSIPSTLTDPPRFSPPRYAVWVNSLWFLSLAVDLTCGLLATFLGQSARRYLKVVQTRFGPHKQARIRAFFAEGVDKWHLTWAVEALHILLHLSLSLFFTGLLILLFNTDHTVFGIVAGWVGLCVAIYGSITLLPIFRNDSPYYSPLSSPAWSLLNGTIFATVRTLYSFQILDHVGFSVRDHMINLGVLSKRRFVEGMVKTAQETALKVSSKIDARALIWTFNSLYEDHKLERFFAAIPEFCSSKLVSDPFGVFIKPYKWRLSDALVGLMHRTLTSDLVSESVRRRRSLICTRAMHAASLSIHPSICEEIINGGWDGLLDHVEFGRFVKMDHYDDASMAYYSTCMVAIVLVRAKERDDLWFELAMGHLGISLPVLRNYLAHSDSVLLANYIHIIRDIIHVHFEQFQSGDSAARWKTLESVSQFEIQGTLPTLQHDFCDLWNEIIHLARTTPDHRVRTFVLASLRNVRRAYIALHGGTNSAPTAFSTSTTDDAHVLFLSSSYPLCNVPDHHPRPASHARVEFSDTTAPSSPTQQTCDLSLFPTSHNTVPSTTSASYSPPSRENVEGHQFPTVTPTSDSAPPVQGAVDAPITSSTSRSVSIARSTQTAMATSTSPAHTSSSYSIPAPASPAIVHTVPHSVAQDTPPPAFETLVLDHAAVTPQLEGKNVRDFP